MYKFWTFSRGIHFNVVLICVFSKPFEKYNNACKAGISFTHDRYPWPTDLTFRKITLIEEPISAKNWNNLKCWSVVLFMNYGFLSEPPKINPSYLNLSVAGLNGPAFKMTCLVVPVNDRNQHDDEQRFYFYFGAFVKFINRTSFFIIAAFITEQKFNLI